MIKPILHDHIIFRVPRFSYQGLISDNWNELKKMIAYASPEFFSIIEKMSFDDLSTADRKVQMTIRKYYNRACFRSTPYGTFSTVGIAAFDWKKDSVIELEQKLSLHSFPDWTNTQKLPEAPFNSDTMLFSNTTFYRVQDEIRYIQKTESEFHVGAVDYDPVIWKVLSFCTIPKTTIQITDHFADLDGKELIGLLGDLTALQLLITSRFTNIIGEDYFSRLGFTDYKEKYLIAERKAITGTFDKAQFRHLPELVRTLQKIGRAYQNPELLGFRNSFIKKYELAEIPIMEALDPEIGVGYGSLASHVSESPVTRLGIKSTVDKNTEPSELRNKLFIEILEHCRTGRAIELSRLIPENTKTAVLPNSFNTVCSVVDGDIWMEALGGASATALSGRFALAIPEIKEYCKEVAALEQSANPDVIFFDIGYTKEIAVDNINRRPAIYNLQLNILNYDTSAAPLSVSDILVSVHGEEVVLRSRSLGKRLIPRSASAYNHRRSDLPLFRLLMDIQYQGLAVDLLPGLRQIIPGLSYYPRLQFRNLILSPAAWQVQVSLIKDIPGWNEKCAVLKEYLQSKLHCSYIKAGSADQTLCLNINSHADIELILSLLEKQKQLYLEEVQIPDTPIMVGDGRKPMLGQFVLTLTHQNEIYKALRPPAAATFSTIQKRWVAPGKDWLYFEIYLNPFQSDMILEGKIDNYLHINKDKIKSWFFIRYSEDGNHIRLRLKLSDELYAHSLTKELTDLVSDELESGLISDIKLRTYKKEVHRYSGLLIDKIEDHFYRDSQFVISMLNAMLPDMSKYKLCITMLEAVAVADSSNEEVCMRIASHMAESLAAEHGLKTDDYKEINRLYRSYIDEQFPSLSIKSSELYTALIRSFLYTIQQYAVDNRAQILADLIHMHINRLFVTDQRLHELIIYTFYLQQQKAIKQRQLYFSKLA